MRALLWVGSLIVALAVVVGAGRLLAEGEKHKLASPAAPRTRLALVNLTYVIKHYQKYIHYQEEMKTAMRPFQEREKNLRIQAEKLSRGIAAGTDLIPAKSEDAEEKLKTLQREMEDNQVKAKKTVGKKTEEAMKTLYLDVTDATQRYAVAHDLELVLHYNEHVTPEERNSPMNIARKLQCGPLTPIYSVAGIDISKELVDILNQSMREE